MRGAADYIFLVEALRSLETQNGRLTKENERLRANQGDPNQTRNDQVCASPASPSSASSSRATRSRGIYKKKSNKSPRKKIK